MENSSAGENSRDRSTSRPSLQKSASKSSLKSENNKKEFGHQRSSNNYQKSFPVKSRPNGKQNNTSHVGNNVLGVGSRKANVNFGTRRGNLNHLVNFSLPVRSHQHSSQQSSSHTRYASRHSGLFFNKEQFLQANCQFVVSDIGDYATHFIDPDKLVNWDLIEQVQLKCDELPNCPICLYPPVVGKMTRCGHIYCWSCILHYLALGEKTWRKCPICFEAVHAADLKSVSMTSQPTFVAGQRLSMSLMKRSKGSTYAMPVNQWTDRIMQPHRLGDPIDGRFVKLFIASKAQVEAIISQERAALSQLYAEVVDTEQECFVQSCLATLTERATELEKRYTMSSTSSSDEEGRGGVVLSPGESHPQVPITRIQSSPSVVFTSAWDDEYYTVDAASSSPSDAPSTPMLSPTTDEETPSPVVDFVELQEESKIEREAQISMALPAGQESGSPTPSSPTDYHYFYQASDGQQIFLHSLNARCLVREYGSLEKAPATIAATIVQMESFSMNSELRHRMRYLGHLPLTCEFRVAELALKPPILSRQTIRAFADEIDRRREVRKRKQRDEKKRARQQEDREKREIEQLPILQASLEQQIKERMQRDTEMAEFCLNDGDVAVGAPAPVEEPGGPELESSESLSFARMLKEGRQRRQPQPAEGGEHTQGAWAAAVAKQPAQLDGDEEMFTAPAYSDSFSEAFQNALQKLKVEDDTETDKKKVEKNGKGGARKKKKRNQKLLFSMGSASTNYD